MESDHKVKSERKGWLLLARTYLTHQELRRRARNNRIVRMAAEVFVPALCNKKGKALLILAALL